MNTRTGVLVSRRARDNGEVFQGSAAAEAGVTDQTLDMADAHGGTINQRF